MIYQSLGYGTGAQVDLTPRDRTFVTNVYTNLTTTCGGTPVVLQAPISGPEPVSTQTVTPTIPSTYDQPTLNKPTINLPGDSPLAFLPDTTTYLHPDQAATYLQALASELHNHPEIHVTITGRTANGTTRWASLKALGQARADTVKADLVRRGILADHITAHGLGYMADPPGDDPIAQANNRVTQFTFN